MPILCAFKPFDGLLACTCLPSVTIFSQRRLFSAISICLPSTEPASGTSTKSFFLNSPFCRRNLTPYLLPASSSATSHMPKSNGISTPIFLVLTMLKLKLQRIDHYLQLPLQLSYHP